MKQLNSPSTDRTRTKRWCHRNTASNMMLGLVAVIGLFFLTPVTSHGQLLSGDPELLLAVDDGDIARVKTLVLRGETLTATTFEGENATMLAARNGDFAMLDYLISLGISLETPDNLGNYPIHWATNDGDYDIAQYLLRKGVDINKPNGRGLSPLMIAAREGYLDILQLYLDWNADLTLTDYTGRTALDFSRDARTPGIQEALRRAGAIQ